MTEIKRLRTESRRLTEQSQTPPSKRLASHFKTNASTFFDQTFTGDNFYQREISDLPNISFQDIPAENQSIVTLGGVINTESILELLESMQMIAFITTRNAEKKGQIFRKMQNNSKLKIQLEQMEERVGLMKKRMEKMKEDIQKRQKMIVERRKKKSEKLETQVREMSGAIQRMKIKLAYKKQNQSASQIQYSKYKFVERSRLMNNPQRKEPRKIFIPIAEPMQSRMSYHPPTYQSHPSPYSTPQIQISPFPTIQHTPFNSKPSSQHSRPPPINQGMLTTHDVANADQQFQRTQIRRFSQQTPNTTIRKPDPNHLQVMSNPLMGNLAVALSMQLRNEVVVEQTNLDYFDSSNNNQEDFIDDRMKLQAKAKKEGRESRQSRSQNKLRDSITSSNWKEKDDEDEELVQLLQNSIKGVSRPPSTEINKKVNTASQQPYLLPPLPQDSRSNSQINITYDSEEKRQSHSFQSKQSDKKISVKSSKKRDRVVSQSNVKIQMSDSKNSSRKSSSKSEREKIQKMIVQIDEESQQMISLKNTPVEGKSNSYVEAVSDSRKKETPKNIKITSSSHLSPNSSSQTSPLSHPPSLLNAPQDEIDLMQQIKLAPISKISKDMPYFSSPKQQQQQDILDSITLLRQSKISREKNGSLKGSALHASFGQDENGQLRGTRSEIKKKQSENDEDIQNMMGQSMNSIMIRKGASAIQRVTVNRQAPIPSNRSTVSRNSLGLISGDMSSVTIEQAQEEDQESPSMNVKYVASKNKNQNARLSLL